jgi:hypothetical protein
MRTDKRETGQTSSIGKIFVMAGPDPAIHHDRVNRRKARQMAILHTFVCWMDGRLKDGHDVWRTLTRTAKAYCDQIELDRIGP